MTLAVMPQLLGLMACHGDQPGTDRVFVSDEVRNLVHVVDGQTGRAEGELRTGGRPRGIALSRDGETLYVAASNADRIEAWSAGELRQERVYRAGSDPERFALTPDGSALLVANED